MMAKVGEGVDQTSHEWVSIKAPYSDPKNYAGTNPRLAHCGGAVNEESINLSEKMQTKKTYLNKFGRFHTIEKRSA